MTIAPLFPGYQRFTGPNGVFLAGGSVTFSIPGTTFGKGTWSDPGQTTANANPITLDSNGGATIFGWGGFREIVKDASGDTIWDSPTFGGQSPQTVLVFNTPGSQNFIVPPGVYTIYVEVVGAGGAGSNCLAPTAVSDVSGGGGGAGGFANGIYAVTPGQTISYSVGAGGAVGSQADGGASNFGAFVSASGGSGAFFASAGTSVGGVGGVGTGGTIISFTGGAGTDGSHIPPSGGQPYQGSGNGGGSYYGEGGTATNGATGGNGQAPGSGGGGVMDVNLTNVTYNGGAGANGQIIIKYWG